MKNTRSKLVAPRGTATKAVKARATSKPTSTRTATKSKPAKASGTSKTSRASEKASSRLNLEMPPDVPAVLTTSERTVLNVFRRYQMMPGQMLCFSGSNLDSHKASLAKLVDKQMVLSEKFRGGYSLTKLGFATMMSAVPLRD